MISFMLFSACPQDDPQQTNNTDATLSDVEPTTDVFEPVEVFEIDVGTNTGIVNGYVFLNGQADHTGVSVVLTGETGHQDLSDSTGFYQIEMVPPGAYNVTANLVGYQAQDSSPFLVRADETTTVEPITLDVAKGSLSGVVLLENETDHSGTVVIVRSTSHACVTNSAGEWLIEFVATSNYAVEASHEGFVTKSVSDQQVNAGLNTEVPTVTLAREPGAISGLVTLTNALDFAGATVVATATWDSEVTCSGITNPVGYYETDECPPGTYTVTASRPTYYSSTVEGVLVSFGAITLDIDLILEPIPAELNCNTPCGTCDSGFVYCSPAGGDPICEGDLGDDALNECGGCETLAASLRSLCGFGTYWLCDGEDAVNCSPPQPVEDVAAVIFIDDSGQPSTDFGTGVELLDDLDGDGRAEIAISAPLYDTGGIHNAGAVFLFPSDLVFSSSVVHEIGLDGSHVRIFGESELEVGPAIESIADLDGDDRSELLVGMGQTGRVGLFMSEQITLSSTLAADDAHTRIEGLPNCVGLIISTDGNVDSDELPDLLLGGSCGCPTTNFSYLYTGTAVAEGGALGPGDAARMFQGSYEVSWLNDLDGDGVTEVVTGGCSSSIYVYLSTHWTGDLIQYYEDAAVVWQVPERCSLCYRSGVHGTPDLTGDGLPDVMVGYSELMGATGYIDVLSGAEAIDGSNPITNSSITLAMNGDPRDFAFVSDWDEDGLAELLVGTPYVASGAGAVYLVGSSTMSEGDLLLDTSATVFRPDGDSGFFGLSISIGDVDGNAIEDFLIGGSVSDEFGVVQNRAYLILNRHDVPE